MVVNGKTYPVNGIYTAAAAGFLDTATAFYNELKGAYLTEAPTGASLKISLASGGVVDITQVQQTRERTSILNDAPNVTARDNRPHYSTTTLTLDSSLSVKP